MDGARTGESRRTRVGDRSESPDRGPDSCPERLMAIVIRRLEERDEVANFDCGDEPLNNYLRRHAWTNQQKNSIGVTYVAVEEAAPQAVLGYFTLAMASAPRDTFPKKHVRGLPPYDLPLILLARLAVDRRFAGRGLGHTLIAEGFRINVRVAR